MRTTVSKWTKVEGRKELLSPTHVLLLIEGEHGGNEPSGGFPVGANSCSASRAVASLGRLAQRGQTDHWFCAACQTCA